jgi:hypothetical protein
VILGGEIARRVVGVVVVVEKVPSRDVVHVAVGGRVPIGAIAECGDQVGGVENSIRLVVPRGVRYPRVLPVVIDVEAVASGKVVGVEAVVVGTVRAVGLLRHRELVAVQSNLGAERSGAPADPRIEDRDLNAGVADGVLPRPIRRDTRNLRVGVPSRRFVLPL